MKRYPSFVSNVERLEGLGPEERREVKEVAEVFPFRANEYYLSLIDWDDPDDPIRRIVVPSPEELGEWGSLDASDEQSYTVLPGLQHKYGDTALFLVNDVCGAICRFCFRKRRFTRRTSHVRLFFDEAVRYIAGHREITNVLLTGGDPLLMTTRKLGEYIRRLREIEHVRIIRIGTKMPAFNPYRILDDPDLPEMIERYSLPGRKLYFMTHFNHPRELTRAAVSALDILSRAGAALCNQTPLLRGINDSPEVLGALFRKLSFAGVPPYYVFICRPTSGNKAFTVPVERAYDIFQTAIMDCSGLAKRARLAMSHSTGKIEVVGRDEENVYFRYHRSFDCVRSSDFMVFRSNPDALWFDDYAEQIAGLSLEYVKRDPGR
ncbi:MAG: KamA family radical SAM protein [Desulfovibrionaceae bacterium]|nr:KamA family radical SAM protein [Desulfovibrionaceae bacterium]MDD4951079.1 KamA family radical SAM protein [Desulfovibrionaceae bacterium]